MKQPIDTDDLGNKLRKHITATAKQNAPPAVQVSVYDGSRQLVDGYVWGVVGDKRVQVIAPGPINLSTATVAAPIVVWALPPNPDEASGAYLMVGSSIDGATNNRAPGLITTGVTVVGSGGGGGGGTVTSVAFTAAPASVFDVTGSPITGSGTIAISMDSQAANTVLAGPTSGGATAPAFRGLVAADIPDISGTYIAKAIGTAKGNLIAFTASATPANLAVGTNGQVLTADSTASAGVAWKDNATSVTNSSGATANAGDVGYIDSTGVYKTTTTAGDIVVWCAVVTGGANTATITVITSGRITLNYTGSAPSAGNCLITSTSAGLVQAQAYYSPSIMAVALAAGSGGTVDALLMTRRTYIPATNAATVMGVSAQSTSDFVSTISGAPSATSVTYGAVTSGNENTIVPASSPFCNLVLWNTTRNTSRLITAVNTGTNVITTVSTADAWASGDTITLRSQTADSGGTPRFFEVSLANQTAIPKNAIALAMSVYFVDTGAAGQYVATHSLETFAISKLNQVQSNVANVPFVGALNATPIIDQKFTVGCLASGAGTGYWNLKMLGYFAATP